MPKRSSNPFGEEYDTSNLVPTYIDNLDAELKGGIPKAHIVLLSGSAGTMKTSLAYYISSKNAEKHGAKAIYFTLEQSRDRIIRSMQQLGLHEDETKVTIADMSKLRIKKEGKDEEIDWLEQLQEAIGAETADNSNLILTIDSLNALYSLNQFSNPRKTLFHFFEFLRSTNATVFLITETSLESPNFSRFSEDFLCDGILNLRFREIKEVGLQLLLICIKMREVPIHRKYYNLDFEMGRFLATTVISRLE